MHRTVIDTTVASAALSSFVWLDYLRETAETLALVGGLVLLGLRIHLAIRELRGKVLAAREDE